MPSRAASVMMSLLSLMALAQRPRSIALARSRRERTLAEGYIST